MALYPEPISHTQHKNQVQQRYVSNHPNRQPNLLSKPKKGRATNLTAMIPNIPNPNPTLLPYLARDSLFERLGGLEEACEGGVEAWWETFLFKSGFCTLGSVLLSRSFRSLGRNLKVKARTKGEAGRSEGTTRGSLTSQKTETEGHKDRK